MYKYKFMTADHVEKLEKLDDSYQDALIAFGKECIDIYKRNRRNGFVKGVVYSMAIIGIYEGTGAIMNKIFKKIEVDECVQETVEG